jgi:uncharacterized protein (TIGR00251 family)
MQPSAIIAVRVIPRASSSKVDGRRGEAWVVRLRTPPVDGAANAELIAVLAAALDVPKRAVTLVSGEKSRLKRVHVAGMDESTIAARLST